MYYGGKLYQFNADHAAGAWDPTDVAEANVTDQVVSNKAAIDELAGSYPADKVMLSDGVTSVENALDKLTSGTFGTEVALTSGVDYVCPADGYIIIIVPNNAETIIGLNNIRVFDVKNGSGTGNYYCVFAKKGMTVYSNFSSGNVSFIPLA